MQFFYKKLGEIFQRCDCFWRNDYICVVKNEEGERGGRYGGQKKD
jgi:hypothetical protein